VLFTVSTVKDSPANVERFVARNLAAGADHMLVFLDARDREVEELLATHDHVTCVVTGDDYWLGRRWTDLNVRQLVNANLANAALAPFGWAEWLFHIDGDEALEIDRERLLEEVPTDTPCVLLDPLEAVSRWHWQGNVDLFKRLLDKPELELLTALGTIDRPDNLAYFRGHVRGKVGMRPGLEWRLFLHRIKTSGYGDVEGFTADWLRLRHYESYDGKEFVRKWLAHVGAGPMRLRPPRDRLRVALEQLAAMDISADVRATYFRDLYCRWIEDDATTLSDLGLLVRPQQGSHQPERLSGQAREYLGRLLGLLAAEDKRHAHPKWPELTPLRAVRRLLPRLDGPLADTVAAEVERARGVVAAREAADSGD
jgi:Glycosyl transferase family 2